MRSGFENWHSNSKDKSTSSAFAAGWMCQQSKIDELTKQRDSFIKAYEIEVDKSVELQKRLDALKGLAQTLWEKSEEKHQQGKVWGSKTLGECADEILDELEQALKGGEA